jgi:hypothetical protein
MLSQLAPDLLDAPFMEGEGGTPLQRVLNQRSQDRI